MFYLSARGGVLAPGQARYPKALIFVTKLLLWPIQKKRRPLSS